MDIVFDPALPFHRQMNLLGDIDAFSVPTAAHTVSELLGESAAPAGAIAVALW